MRRNKLAQITLYIILGMILVFVVGVGVYFVSNVSDNKSEKASENTQKLSLEAQPVEVFLQECLKKISVQSAYEFGYQSGYYDAKPPYLDTNYTKIAYYYYKGNSLLPELEVLENELSDLITENLMFGCSDFSAFEKLGFNVSFQSINVTTKIIDNQVFVNANYDLSAEKEESIKNIERLSYTLPFRIGHIHSISRDLVEAVVDRPYAIDLTLLLNYDVDISVVHYDECNDVYILVDNQSKAKPTDDDFVFAFATGIEEKYCKPDSVASQNQVEIFFPEIENHNPVFDFVPTLNAKINQEFAYRLNAFDEDNDTIFYLTEGLTQNFTNVLSGEIKFTPIGSQIGIHMINASVVDINSGSDSKEFYLIIE